MNIHTKLKINVNFTQQLTDSKNVDKADAHDDSVNKELNTDLKRHSEEAKVTNTSDEDNVGTSLEPSSEYKTAGDEPFPTNDEKEKKTLDCPATPTDQNIESQMKVMLDSIYGKSWRAHQQKVFLPMSERKVKRSDNIPIVAPITESSITTDEEYDKEIEILELTRNKTVREKNKKYSFLESLSATVPLNQCDMSARLFRTNFKQHKQELAKRLFSLFNENVFDDAIPGNCAIEWNTKLTKTAGLCHFKKITHRQGQIERQVKISLSTKVLDSPCRLRDTLIHEMCHAASFIVNRITDGHGPYWKKLPPIRRCHDYRINSKYTYKCTGCHYSFGRHTKSLDLDRKRCGYCMGRFEVFLNKKGKSGSTKAVPIAERKEVTGFALFVKENYAKYKEPSKTHRDIMTMLSQKFAELKVISTK
ncbi:hypothetical protein D910_07641 [Dendroctonus ponderosae]|uniref:SprT-like domain-containing protein n=1 Tax=Dendroctonus ponderosae TaxID=77166 RepID=U4TV78_DENPD|nr:hypothetical protein D910_01085 [Dendroctonus ponderosae]ERL90289.1 hypothetical protein D910_07641 [Dendroctonus ponderosae]